jgi:FKBP-type peptidyl-prolyl cis-trans isomerase SlyD
MRVSKDRIVSLEYQLHLGDGETIDQSAPGQPVAYLHGRGHLVPGLEGALEGMEEGDTRSVVVPPASGYGEHDERGVQEVPRQVFPEDLQIRAGAMLTAQTPEGETIPLTVREVREETVLVDLNHPLAGKTLHYSVTVREVREATPEELEHGHAHGPHGAH